MLDKGGRYFISGIVHGVSWDFSLPDFRQVKDFLLVTFVEGSIGVTAGLMVADGLTDLRGALLYFLQSLIYPYKLFVFLFLSDAVTAAVWVGPLLPWLPSPFLCPSLINKTINIIDLRSHPIYHLTRRCLRPAYFIVNFLAMYGMGFNGVIVGNW